MQQKKRKEEVMVNKSVSMPLSLIEAILDEADYMHTNFSGAVSTLLRTGIAARRIGRDQEDQAAVDRLKSMVKKGE